MRLRYGRIVSSAYLLLFSGSFLLLMRHSAGPGSGFAISGATRALFWGVIAPHSGPSLLVWLSLTWVIFNLNRSWKGRNWIALTPALVFFLFQATMVVVQPPSPRKYFLATFDVPLPKDAKIVKVVHPTLADPGFVEFAFRCSKESTNSLIDQMKLTRMVTEPYRPVGGTTVGQEWGLDSWVTPNQFAKVQRTGTGHLLIADLKMQRVVVLRNPLFAKSEAQYPEGKYVD